MSWFLIPANVILFGNEVFADDQVIMRSYSNMSLLLQKSGHSDRHTHGDNATRRRQRLGDVSTSQGTAMTASNNGNQRRDLTAHRRAQPCWPWISDFLTPQLGPISVVWTAQFALLAYGNQEIIHKTSHRPRKPWCKVAGVKYHVGLSVPRAGRRTEGT